MQAKGQVETILEALTVAAELTGTEFSDVSKAAIVKELLQYPTENALAALDRCRRELTGRLSLAAILERIDDGIPSADEAFGMLVEGWHNEDMTVVVPDIAMTASGNGALELFKIGDKTGARMAFRDSYVRLAADVKAGKRQMTWFVSKGNNRDHQVSAVMEAVRLGRLPQSRAVMYLPTEAAEERYLIETGKVLTSEQRQLGQRVAANLLELLEKKAMPNAD